MSDPTLDQMAILHLSEQIFRLEGMVKELQLQKGRQERINRRLLNRLEELCLRITGRDGQA